MLDLYSDYNTLPVHELHLQQLLLFVFRVLKPPYRIPTVFKNYFDLNKDVHEHNTRLSKGIHVHRANSQYGQRCLKCMLVEQITRTDKNAARFSFRV